MVNVVHIHTPYITLGQLLKLVGAIDTGGQAKWFLAEYPVLVNGEAEQRRGRKLYPDDVVHIDGAGQFKIVQDS
ncbi:S4 domain protein YaaA [Caldalkalibacillus uzonensis]|uniref:S4 domain protein YaaA n=1 Tax=Caldalkalibacillus uzonensis TaxID=353224 RepID=A0ABU0CT41_9BACI|nr:S4 domain-containing protein YaaA [Caldalkalibacillus uzonensis]MDQ0339273.1 S4 domain protein YaaA [Caldalkalibacillus uzonensis]